MNLKIEIVRMKNRVLAVYVDNDIYVASGKSLINISTNTVLCRHDKSIRSISGNSVYIGCSSYDGTATLIDRISGEYIDRIEGPDTEIKGIAFYKDFIAVATRGKTVWILEHLEISKILEEHTQDVKGCCFYEKRLCTWSYDNTIKIFELFEIEHSWELIQSIDLGSIVWTVSFINGMMVSTLQNGEIVVLKKDGELWCQIKTIKASVYPIVCSCNTEEYFITICNRRCLRIYNKDFSILNEALLEPNDEDTSGSISDITCCAFDKINNQIICGSEDGYIYKVHL